MSLQNEPHFAEPLHVGRPNIGSPERFHALVGDVLDRRWLSNDGPMVKELEARIAEWIGVKHVVAVSNGTVAMEIAVRALGLTGEVIVPSWTFVATVHALRWMGITPVFADIDPATHNIDPNDVRRLITPRTSGILAVHLWGRAAPVHELSKISEEFGVPVLYDAAHSFGVSTRGQMVGNFGSAEVFSFHATKFFNTLEGGAIVTNDDDLAGRIRLMRNFGFAGEDNVVSEGINGKMHEISAAMGVVNFDHIDEFIERNLRNRERYEKGIQRLEGVSLLPLERGEKSNYQYVVLEVDESAPVTRDALLSTLREKNVLARRYFWPSVHRMEPYRTESPEAGRRLPHTERVSERVIVLPTGTAVDEDAIDTIVGIIATALNQS